MSYGKRRKRIRYLLISVAVCGTHSTAFAQLNSAGVGLSGNFGGITNIGQLRTSVSGSLARFSSGTPSGGSSSNAVSFSSRGGSAFRGRRNPSIRGFGTTPVQSGRSGGIMMFFGRSPSARIFSGPDYDGRGSAVPLPTPGFSTASTRGIINQQHSLPVLKSFHHRALLPTVGGAVRDELTNTSLQNAQPIPENVSYESNTGVSQAEFFSQKIEARYKRYLSRGWDQLKVDELKAYQFIVGRAAFKNASLIHPNELEPRIGKLICALGASEFSTASAELRAIVAGDHDLTSIALSTGEIFSDSTASKRILAKLTTMTYRSGSSVDFLALHAYMLWIDGQQTAALSAARKINTEFRTTSYAALADQLISILEEQKSNTEAPVASG